MRRFERVIRLGLSSLAIGAVVGVLATAAGAWLAMRNACNQGSLPFVGGVVRRAGGPDVMVDVTIDRWATCVETWFLYAEVPCPPGTATFAEVHALLWEEEEKSRRAGFLPPDYRRLTTSRELSSDWFAWHRGLSPIMDRGVPNTETVYGWPFRCLRVRGRSLVEGPLRFSQIRARVGRGTGWSLSARETGLSVAAFGLPASVAAGGAMGFWGRFRSWRRASKGQCRSCGYDLRGCLGACPECGNR
jgi:hypothetical protein